jgi:hypothetical protein
MQSFVNLWLIHEETIHEETQRDYHKGGTQETRGKLRQKRETQGTGRRRGASPEEMRQRGWQTGNALSPRCKVVVAEVALRVQARAKGTSGGAPASPERWR